MLLDLTTKVIRSKDLMIAPVDKDTVILNLAKNNYITLDAIGSRIWILTESAISVSDICHVLSFEFSGDISNIQKDVISFLNELIDEGIMNVST